MRRRSGTVFSRAWAFPGGAVDPNDRAGGARLSTVAARAAARELAEEAGIVAAHNELEPLLGPIVTTDADRQFDVRFFAFWTDQSVSVRLNAAELTAHRWLSPADALHRAADETLYVPPATKAALAALNQKVRTGEAGTWWSSNDGGDGSVP